MKILWSPEARADLRAIYEYIAADNPRAALAVQQCLKEKIALLSHTPGLGRPGRIEGTRELVIGDYPYIIPYRYKAGVIEIIRVLHTSRQWPEGF